ncbi:Probable pectinesterase/pectinesterase inhibitor 41 [Linum perenne]
MASSVKLLPLATAVFLLSFIAPAFPQQNKTVSAPGNFCSTTPFPAFCRSTLPYTKNTSIHDYTRKSVHQSLSQARQFRRLINYLLKKASRSDPFQTLVPPLQDCQFLAQSNLDSLSDTMSTIKSQDKLQTFQASDLQTLLSATLTNLDTCLDGIRAADSSSNVINSLVAPLLNGTKYCSVSLALFAKGWVPPQKKRNQTSSFSHEFATLDLSRGLPLAMSAQDRRVFESFGEMKIAETGKKGVGNFTTINDAIDSAPNSTSYYVIYVTEGYYEEYISIHKKKHNLMIIGDGIGKTTITGNRSVVDGWTTFNSSTFSVVAPGFVAVGITFKNTAGPAKRQAVAVRNGADMSAFFNCSFQGYQDTLYVHSFRQFYRDCEVYGTVDFIFGNAAAVLQNCRIMSRLPMIHQFNAITAQGRTDPNQNTGISIQNCSIKAAKNGTITAHPDMKDDWKNFKSYLGRPWKNFSRTVIMESYIDELISPDGWLPWMGTVGLKTCWYGEYGNYGPGADKSKRVTWLGIKKITPQHAVDFTPERFIRSDTWVKPTGIPYISYMVKPSTSRRVETELITEG